MDPYVGEIMASEVIVICEVEGMKAATISLSLSVLLPSSMQEVTSPSIVTEDYSLRKEVIFNGISCIILNMGSRPHGIYTLNVKQKDTTLHTMKVKYSPEVKRLAFFSADMPEGDPLKPLWEEIVHFNPDLIVHVGDNVYMDKAFTKALKTASKGVNLKDHAYALFKKRYLKTFSRWIEHIGQFSNVFGMGDHDIARVRERWDKLNTEESIAASVALNLYDSYQGDSIYDPIFNGEERSWAKAWVVERRVVSMIFLSRPFGSNAMTSSTSAMMSEMHPDTSLLIIVTAIPPHNIDNIVYGSPTTDESIVSFLDTVWEWLALDDGRRALIVSGNSHYGMSARIARGNNDTSSRLQVAVASPISAQPLASDGVEMAKVFSYKVGEYRYVVSEVVLRRNFLRVEIVENGFHISFVHSHHMLPSPGAVVEAAKYFIG